MIVDHTAYVVDCGDGVARQLVLAGVPLTTIRHVFLTHHHSDHNADYGNLLPRFDTPDRSIVISGDTTRSDGLVALARGADILVHEALFPEGVDRLVAGVKNAANLKQSVLAHHTTAEDVGRVAQAAGVKMLVLSHLVPAEDPAITDRMWIDAASRPFRGRVVMGRDLLEI